MATTTYEFRIDGQLCEQAREAFCDMDIEELAVGAALVGTVIDEAHLLGVMALCRTLGLVVISAHRTSGGTRGQTLPRRAPGDEDQASSVRGQAGRVRGPEAVGTPTARTGRS
jgi:hypothetical protein